MLKRNELNDEAKRLQEEHAYEENGHVLTSNSAIFYADASREYALFKAAISGKENDSDTVSAAKRPVVAALTRYNDEQRMIRLEQLSAMTGKDAMRSYLDTQCVKGFDLKNVKDEGWKLVETTTVELLAYDFISEICSADLNGILDACCIFVDNVAKNEFGEDAAISRKSMSDSYIAMRKRMGWEISKGEKQTNKKLAAQLTEICNMISFKTSPVMQNADVKFIKFFVISARSKANEVGRFIVRNDATIVEAIFRAMYTRKNNKPYKWQNQNNSGNSARTVAANGDMAESSKLEEFSGRVEAEAGEITLGTPEK